MVGNLQNSLTDKGLHIQIIADNPSTSRDTPSQHAVTPNGHDNTPVTKVTTTTSSSGMSRGSGHSGMSGVSGHSRSTDGNVENIENDKTPSLRPQKVDDARYSNHEHRASAEAMDRKEHDSLSRISASAEMLEIVDTAEDAVASNEIAMTLPLSMKFADSANDDSVHIAEEEKEQGDPSPLSPPAIEIEDVAAIQIGPSAVDMDDESKSRHSADDHKKVDCDGDREDAVVHVHDGFGNIDYLRVFDDAVLELIRLIKADTWRRFKQSQEFKDWAADFRAS